MPGEFEEQQSVSRDGSRAQAEVVCLRLDTLDERSVSLTQKTEFEVGKSALSICLAIGMHKCLLAGQLAEVSSC